MTTEEKAKAYDEALNRAKGFKTRECRDVAEYIFPILAESEDEKIRKALIKLVKQSGEGYDNIVEGVSVVSAIAWLEKQGEQKQWKPTEEQIQALEGCVDFLENSGNEDLCVMESLLEQLKAL